MRTMTDDEYRAFMTGRPAHTGKLGTTRTDGRPHVAPIWYDLDTDGTVVFTTGADTLKGKALRRDPRVCLCVDDETPPFSFVIVEGTAGISHDLDEMLAWATRIGGRYMGDDQAEAYGRRNAVPEEMLVRVTPSRVVARAGITD
jgi:PPOX class probable F420-dependent enzyme